MRKLDDILGRMRHWVRPWTEGTEPMEIHRAILEEVETKATTARGGRRVFPFNRLEVRLLAANSEERSLLAAVADEGWDLASEIRERLAGRDCQVPADLAVAVAVVEQGGAEFGGRRFAVRYARAEEGAARPAARPALELTVLQGTATQRVYTPGGERVHLGRLPEVLDEDGRVRRRNDVVFTEQEGINETVSREHARISWDAAAGGYRLRDEGSARGTRIFRDGRSIPVSGHDPRGVLLQGGDEVYLGGACLKVGLRPPEG
jgi:FHA domain-containing protein